jgi:sulfopyruvate decarboxylase subunit beta
MANLTTAAFLDSVSATRDPDDVVIATMTAGWIWHAHSDNDHDLSYIAPMGSVSAFGHGLTLALPDLNVAVIDGDGSILMNLGSLVSIGGSNASHLLHIVLENGGYAITGGQPLPGSGTTGLVEMALAAGYKGAVRSEDPQDLEAAFESIHEGKGPVMLVVPVEPAFDGTKLAEWTQNEQSRRTLGPPGFKRLRELLASGSGA